MCYSELRLNEIKAKNMAKFAILRTGKLKSAASVRGMLKHNFRDIDTPNADENLTPDNEHLAAQSVKDGMKRYRDSLPEKVRSNAVHAIDYMITTSKEASPEAKESAMQEAYDWLAEKHGKENIIMASKHRDETTPHIHVVVVPIDEKGKLNARQFIGGTRHRMSDLQDEFYKRLQDKNIDLDRGIKGSRAKHQSIKEWNAKVERADAHRTNQSYGEINKDRDRRKTGTFSRESQQEADLRVIHKLHEKIIDQGQLIDKLAMEKDRQKRTIDANKKAVEMIKKLKSDVSRGDQGAVKKFSDTITRAADRNAEAKAKRESERRARGSKPRGISR